MHAIQIKSIKLTTHFKLYVNSEVNNQSQQSQLWSSCWNEKLSKDCKETRRQWGQEVGLTSRGNIHLKSSPERESPTLSGKILRKKENWRIRALDTGESKVNVIRIYRTRFSMVVLGKYNSWLDIGREFGRTWHLLEVVVKTEARGGN